MTGTQFWPSLLLGFGIGLAVPKRIVHEWSVLVKVRLFAYIQEHVIAAVLIGLLVGVAGMTAGFVGLAYGVSHNSDQTSRLASDEAALRSQAAKTDAQFRHYRTCINKYAKKVHDSQVARTEAAQRLQDAQQLVVDDNLVLWRYVARSLSGQDVPHSVAEKALGTYIADAAKEQRLARQLTRARQVNPIPAAPEVACR